ncbi:MAG: nuclease-related domain-containing protein [Undibacterium sp.]|nr:nuclease-related domain-containing protein [Undibacterium sp.]
MLIKRLVPVHTRLDYADSRLKLIVDAKNTVRVLDKQKTQDAIHATYVTAEDFNMLFEHRQDVAVLHDLRISMPDGQMHIDHLFITDTFQVFIVESRTAESKLVLGANRHFTSTDEEAETCVIPSPIQQLKKNRFVMKRVLQQIDLPTRFGRKLMPQFHNFVLIDANAEFSNRLGSDDEYFLSPEQLMSLIDQQSQKKSLLSFMNKMSETELRRIARRIASMHMPKKIRFSNKFRHVLLPCVEPASFEQNALVR